MIFGLLCFIYIQLLWYCTMKPPASGRFLRLVQGCDRVWDVSPSKRGLGRRTVTQYVVEAQRSHPVPRVRCSRFFLPINSRLCICFHLHTPTHFLSRSILPFKPFSPVSDLCRSPATPLSTHLSNSLRVGDPKLVSHPRTRRWKCPEAGDFIMQYHNNWI